MNPQQIRDMLAATLEDRRLSRSEKTALDRIFEHVGPSAQQIAHYRSIAFDLAREGIDDPNALETIRWLEEVVKRLALVHDGGEHAAVAECHFSPSDGCPDRIASFLAAAKRSVDICVFTITDDRITEAVIAAHRHGRRLRVVTDNDKAGDLGSDVERIASAGVPVRVDRTDAHMHHKYAIVDGTYLLNGSYNWTRSAARENEENFVITGDQRFVGPFAERFERLWSSLAD